MGVRSATPSHLVLRGITCDVTLVLDGGSGPGSVLRENTVFPEYKSNSDYETIVYWNKECAEKVELGTKIMMGEDFQLERRP